MPGFRMGRINSQLQREISTILAHSVKDEKLSEVIITSVDCTKDLKYAKVYYTTLREEGRATIAKLLEKVSGYVRTSLGRVMALRTVPELTFRFDDSEILAREMDAVLDRIAQSSGAQPENQAIPEHKESAE